MYLIGCPDHVFKLEVWVEGHWGRATKLVGVWLLTWKVVPCCTCIYDVPINHPQETQQLCSYPLPRTHRAHLHLFIYLFIYCHLYSAFSIVQCSYALYRLWDGKIQGYTGQPSVREIDAHTMYNQWATAPGRSLNYPRPKSITHLRTFSDNGVYVALQLFLVIVVSDQWRRVLIPYSYRQAPWGLLHARGWLSRYTWDQQLYVVSEPRETHSPKLKARFLHLTNFGSSRGSDLD